MSKRKPRFITGNFYHIYNRGVVKLPIFINDQDYRKFCSQIFKNERKYGEVKMYCYCLMPNHFHILVKQLVSDGISLFLHRLLVGYTAYFNYKYERTGHVFEGRTKCSFINSKGSFIEVSRYIHRNPLKILQADDDILRYEFSSFVFYVTNIIAERSFLLSLFDNDPKKYERFVLFDQ